MKNVYVAATALFYIVLLSVIVFKTALEHGNVINMIFAASSFTIVLSLLKVIVDSVRGAEAQDPRR